MNYEKINIFKPEELYWDFDSKNPAYYKINQLCSSYKNFRTINVDPFPCASHNKNILEILINLIEDKFKTNAIVRYFSIPNEIISRTNAYVIHEHIWSEDFKLQKEKNIIEIYVVFSGKRTIIHPIMTKYLVSHEYGHVVDLWITEKMKLELNERDNNIFRKKYCEIRGIKFNDEYGGGRWVDNTREIIADDFRIIMGETDINFYPHSCQHPLENETIVNYWNELKEKYDTRNKI